MAYRMQLCRLHHPSFVNLDCHLSILMSLSPRQTDIFLQPGEFFVGDATMRLRTMLGSCVAITLWHPHARIGAMSHFLLANRGRPKVVSEELDGSYGDEALELMIRGLKKEGVEPQGCEAKIFGGGNMFPMTPKLLAYPIGLRNGEAAHRMLAEKGIAVRREHLYGDGHRQVIFDIATGAVWVRQVPPNLVGNQLN